MNHATFVLFLKLKAKKPRLSQRLIGVSADVGDNVELLATVEGIPQPMVTWLRNGEPFIGKATASVVDHERAHHRLVLENIKVIRSEANHLIMPQIQTRT